MDIRGFFSGASFDFEDRFTDFEVIFVDDASTDSPETR
jgi:glycosyltransferase involved in cell wall biosynthesis